MAPSLDSRAEKTLTILKFKSSRSIYYHLVVAFSVAFSGGDSIASVAMPYH